MKFYTTGYGGRRPEEFLALLVSHEVKTVVDVRAQPHRASMGAYVLAEFPDKGIQRLLDSGGLSYVSFAAELGNPFRDQEDWRPSYAGHLAAHAAEVVQLLAKMPAPYCLLCAEKRHTECHRQLVADLLVGLGHEVEHIE